MASTALETLATRVQVRLEGAEALSGVTILWGPPTGDDKPAELVMVGSDADANSGSSEREFHLVGNQQVDEEISLPITVEVSQAHQGTDLKGIYERSTAVARAVEEAIREDISFEHLFIREAILSEWRGRYFRAGEARGHHIFLTLSGRTRI